MTEERLLLVRKNRNDCRNGSLFNVSEGLLHSASVMLEQHEQCAVRTEARRLGASSRSLDTASVHFYDQADGKRQRELEPGSILGELLGKASEAVSFACFVEFFILNATCNC